MRRLEELQKQLHRNGIDLAIIMNPRDVYYYTGTGQPSNLLVPRYGRPVLQVRRAWDFARDEVGNLSCIINKGGSFSDIEAVLSNLPFPVRTVGVTMDAIPASLYKRIDNMLAPNMITNISTIILQQRAIKEESEIDDIRNAAKGFEVVHETVINELVPGITELELSARVLKSVRSSGFDSIIRNRRWDASLPPDGLVVSSTNAWRISGHAMTVTGKGLSPSLPWGASDTTINKGDLVVIDIGLNYKGYHADVARTYVVGQANSKQKEVFEAVFSLQAAALSVIKAGAVAKDVYKATYQKAVSMRVHEYFQGYGEMQGDYIAHGIGLEIDEPPTLQSQSNEILEAGMILAVEPKLIIPKWGAIDLEDDVLVTEDGYELISTVPRELFEVG